MAASTELDMQARWIVDWDGELVQGVLPRPTAGCAEVLVEVEACGVGLTVLNCIRGDLARGIATTPRVPGHEFVGRIIDVGDGVDPRRVGERVMAFFYLFCGECRRCLAAEESLCENLGGFVGVDIDGGYASYAVLPSRNAVRVPESIDAVAATAIPDAIATSVHIAAQTRIGPADRVVVIGAGGGVGVHMVQIAKLRGATVIGLESQAEKRAFLTRELGIEAIDSREFAHLALPATWDRGADVIVDLLGSESSLRWALNAVREAGRVAVLTTFLDVEVPVRPRDLVFRQASIVGSRYASRYELGLAAELVASGRIRAIVSERASASDVDTLHDRLRCGELLGRGALTWNTHPPTTGHLQVAPEEEI